jgi:hypothetical protein
LIKVQCPLFVPLFVPWPKDDKAKQKLIALEIAKVAKFVPVKDGV